MAYVKGRLFDRNRYGKKYPIVRAPKKLTFMGETDLQIEVLTIDFENESEKDGFFEVPYEDTSFRILVSPRDTVDTDSAQVSLAVNHTQTDVNKVRVEASAPFTGKVDVIVLRIGS